MSTFLTIILIFSLFLLMLGGWIITACVSGAVHTDEHPRQHSYDYDLDELQEPIQQLKNRKN